MSISVSEATNIQKNHGWIQGILAMVFCLLSCTNFAQQEWQFSQYQFNLYDLNAAYAGAYDETSVAIRYRQMWTGFDGAPQSAHFSIHSPLHKSFGGGIKLLSEDLGLHSRFSLKASGAYGFGLGQGRMAFALSAGFIQQSFRSEELLLRNLNDPIFFENLMSSTIAFDFAAIYFQENLYAGFQVENLDMNSKNGQNMHLNATAGYVYKIGKEHVIRPSMMIRYTEGAPLQAEFHASFLWQNRIWLGGGYRYDYGWVVTTEWKVTPSLRLGYSLDIAKNEIQAYQNGSHEVFLGYNFKLNSQKPPSIRFF